MSARALYSAWRAFYAEKVRSWMSLEELRTGCGKLQTVDGPSAELLLIHAMHALEEREAHAETNRAMTNALLMMEEREQRDEALLRQALEALEQIATELPWELTGLQADTIAALRERLGEKA